MRAALDLGAVSILLISGASFQMFRTLPNEYAPMEDRGMILVWMRGPEGATPDYMDRQIRQFERIAIPYVDAGYAKRVLVRSGMGNGGGDANTGFAYIPLMPWKDRDMTSMEIAEEMRGKLSSTPAC